MCLAVLHHIFLMSYIRGKSNRLLYVAIQVPSVCMWPDSITGGKEAWRNAYIDLTTEYNQPLMLLQLHYLKECTYLSHKCKDCDSVGPTEGIVSISAILILTQIKIRRISKRKTKRTTRATKDQISQNRQHYYE